MFKKLAVFSVVVLLCCGASVAARAASACYTQAEAEAEQAIRIHSELMVIGLNCQHKYKAGNQNLYVAYRTFSARHGQVFAAYERALLNYFRRAGDRDPESSLNALRTAFANKIATDAARMRPDLFCYEYAPRIEKVSTMNESALRQWAGTFYTSHPVSKPLCK